ncbi:hypothetical protein B0H14DRAFT_3887419 [Mycena olivaceomarginata]|nr:hypothetical protein B0H14DRAFT_3887419 [Mycena olivaceomarginata]
MPPATCRRPPSLFSPFPAPTLGGKTWKQLAALSGRPYVHPPPPRESAKRRSRVVVETDPDLAGLEAAQARAAATIGCEMDLDSEHEEVVRRRDCILYPIKRHEARDGGSGTLIGTPIEGPPLLRARFTHSSTCSPVGVTPAPAPASSPAPTLAPARAKPPLPNTPPSPAPVGLPNLRLRPHRYLTLRVDSERANPGVIVDLTKRRGDEGGSHSGFAILTDALF